MGLFDFLDMLDNSDDRAIARYEGENSLIVDTCFVTDSAKSCETAISHPRYNNGEWIIVESYDTEFEARAAHEQWVRIMTEEELPDALLDQGAAGVALLSDLLSKGRRVFWIDGKRPNAIKRLARNDGKKR